MPRVVKLNYASFLDVRSGIEFVKTEDKRLHTFVAMAEVPDDQMHFFAGHKGFRVVEDAEYAAMMGIKPVDPNAPPVTVPLPDAPLSPDEQAKADALKAEIARTQADKAAYADTEANSKAASDAAKGAALKAKQEAFDAAVAKQEADAKAAAEVAKAQADAAKTATVKEGAKAPTAKDPLSDAPAPPPSS